MPTAETKRIIRGTIPSAPSPAGGRPLLRYTSQNPSPQARAYYQNVVPAMQRLIGNKHDEAYTDPATGKQCTANSCLSFATTVLDEASGSKTTRSKQNLYNPEFTRTAEQQGWVQIPVDKMQPGDRLQSWQPVGTTTANDFKVADLGGRQLLPGRVPVHMTVFGGWQDKPTPANPGLATVYQDGHAFRAADSQVRPINSREWVAYRFVGTGGPSEEGDEPAATTAPRTIKGTSALR